MDELGLDELYLFVVDTDKYAGNFERCMCAHMTGVVGESDVGDESASDYRETFGNAEDFDHNDHIVQLAGEHGHNPVGIFGSGINSFAIFMDRMPTEEEISRMSRRAVDYVSGPYGKPHKIKIFGFRLFSRIVTQKELPLS